MFSSSRESIHHNIVSYPHSLILIRCTDFHGAFSETTGTNAPIYYQGWGEDDFDVHSCVQNWLVSGVSREKISKLLLQVAYYVIG